MITLLIVASLIYITNAERLYCVSKGAHAYYQGTCMLLKSNSYENACKLIPTLNMTADNLDHKWAKHCNSILLDDGIKVMQASKILEACFHVFNATDVTYISAVATATITKEKIVAITSKTSTYISVVSIVNVEILTFMSAYVAEATPTV